jgi:hypothetical protein
MTIDDHGTYWRQIAAEESANGNERLSEDYLRMAAVAESLNALLTNAGHQAEALARTVKEVAL